MCIRDSKEAQKFTLGPTPPPPTRSAVIARPRGYPIGAAVHRDYKIAADGYSTPVLRLDLRDLQ
eukprot:5729455-Prymnesium_polylepis.1